MASIGHRTGLFAHFAKADSSTPADLARKAGLAERYVREWLAVMTTSGVAEYDPAAETYRLPAEHAAFLTYGGSSYLEKNVAHPPRLVPLHDWRKCLLMPRDRIRMWCLWAASCDGIGALRIVALK
jgi:DNA-binding IclR family transcriptional regulator